MPTLHCALKQMMNLSGTVSMQSKQNSSAMVNGQRSWLCSGRRLFMSCWLVSILGTAPVHAVCDDYPSIPESMEVLAGMQEVLELHVPLERIAIGSPDVADVDLVGKSAVLITARQAGYTSLRVWNECVDHSEVVFLIVRDPAAAEATGGIAFEHEKGLIPQVQTDIRIVEVSRTKLREVGSSLFIRSGAFNMGFGEPANFAGQVGAAIATGLVSQSGFNILFGGGSRDFLVALDALEQSGFAYTLAEPSLVALSGQSANFLAGGEFPVPVRAGITEAVTVQFKEFGVRLALTPTILDNDHIMLRVAPEVSELDFAAGIESAGVAVPALRVRRTETSIKLGDGESFVISGLISTRTTSDVDRLPGLGEIPILGAFFRKSQLETEDRELLMVVTPRLVRPLRSDARTPELPGEDFRHYRPSFLDFYLLEDGSFGRSDGFGFSR